MGTQTVFIDNANEQHNMILLKHFTEKNHAVVVDVKTRKRKTGSISSRLGALPVHRNRHGINHLFTPFFVFTVKDYQLIQSQDSTVATLPGQGPSKTLLSRYLTNFTSIISHLLQTSHDNGCPDAVEASWVLSLALKGLYNTLKVPVSREEICTFGAFFNFCRV